MLFVGQPVRTLSLCIWNVCQLSSPFCSVASVWSELFMDDFWHISMSINWVMFAWLPHRNVPLYNAFIFFCGQFKILFLKNFSTFNPQATFRQPLRKCSTSSLPFAWITQTWSETRGLQCLPLHVYRSGFLKVCNDELKVWKPWLLFQINNSLVRLWPAMAVQWVQMSPFSLLNHNRKSANYKPLPVSNEE